MLLQAVGKPKIATKISLISAIILIVLTFTLHEYLGLFGIVYALIITRIISLIYGLVQGAKILKYLENIKNIELKTA